MGEPGEAGMEVPIAAEHPWSSGPRELVGILAQQKTELFTRSAGPRFLPNSTPHKTRAASP